MTDTSFLGAARGASSPPGRVAMLAEVRTLLCLAMPIALIALVNMGMSVTDTLMVSHAFGADGLAAVAVGSDLHSILFYLGAGVIAGLSPFYTAAATRRDVAEQTRLERLGLVLVGFCAALLCPLIWTAPDWLVSVGIDAHLLESGRGYTRTMAPTLAVMLAVSLYRTILTADHRPGLFLKVTLGMLPLNAAGNLILMQGLGPVPAFGPTGAGLSSLLVASASLSALVFASRRSRTPAPPNAPIRILEVAAVLRVGLPIGIATLAEVGVFLAATIYAASLGTAAVAAHTLTLRVAGVAYAVPAAMLQATMVRMARAEALGDQHLARTVSRVALGLSVIFGLVVMATLVLATAPLTAGVFRATPSSAQVSALASGLLFLLAGMEFLVNPASTAIGILRAWRDTRVPMLISVFGYWVIGGPLGLWLCEVQGQGVYGIWTGLAVGTVATCTLTLGRLRYARRPAG